MENNLKLLIFLLEKEKILLQKLIADCVVEAEYLMAHYHSKALYQLNRKLQTLRNIDDKLFDEKDFRQKTIVRLQKLIDNENIGNIKEYYLKKVELAKNELEVLNKIPKQETLLDNVTLLDKTLKMLLYKKSKNVKLILKKSDNLFLAFNYSKKVLKVTLPYVKQHTKKRILYDDKINCFKNLGFDLSENETRLILILTGNKEDILNRLKIILSKIVFEVFYFKDFNDESYIQFEDKASL